jgi:ketosteroid isomerase-like protein
MSDAASHPFVRRWHAAVAARSAAAVQELLHDDVVFRAPVYWKPRVGRAMVTAILSETMD